MSARITKRLFWRDRHGSRDSGVLFIGVSHGIVVCTTQESWAGRYPAGHCNGRALYTTLGIVLLFEFSSRGREVTGLFAFLGPGYGHPSLGIILFYRYSRFKRSGGVRSGFVSLFLEGSKATSMGWKASWVIGRMSHQEGARSSIHTFAV